MHLITNIRARAEEHRGRYLSDLTKLVEIDSGTYDKAGVDRAGRLMRDLLVNLGFAVTFHDNEQLGNNLEGRLFGSGARRLLLIGHLDTVYPMGTVAERPMTVRDGRAYGPAACDMKGGLTLAVYAVRVLRELGWDDFAEIAFIANSDEEIGSPTSRALIEDTARRMDAVFVLEPGKSPGGVLATRKGVGMYQLEIRGRASHAGAAPNEGRSANLELAHKVVALHELNQVDSGTTVSANVIRGGTARNVIPAEAYAGIDVRVKTKSEANRIDRAIQEIAERSWVPGTSSRLTGGLNRPPMEKLPGTRALLNTAREIVEELGLEFQELTSGGGSDGNFTAAAGIPTLDGLGPVGRNAHSVDEYIELDSLVDRISLVAALLARTPTRAR